MILKQFLVFLGFAFAAQAVAAQPYALNDIRLGLSYANLAKQLEMRDAEEAVREARAMSLSRPYFGKRGYGCLRRDDPGADITCVSHEEKLGGAETREIRLQFLDGILQQLSVTAEMKHADAVIAAVARGAGEPKVEGSGSNATWRWSNGESAITGYGGANQVFVVFNLASYPAAVERKKQRGPTEIECR